MTGLSSATIMSGNFSPTTSVERAETISSGDHISELPEETIQHIFSYLHPIELGSNSQVSRRWHRLSSDPYLWNALDLTKTFPHLSIFEASDWEKHFGFSVEDEPPIDKRTLFPILKQFASLPVEKLPEENEGEHIEKDAGVTLLTIPKGLTLKKLIEMAKEGDKVKFMDIEKDLLREIGDIEVDATYRILITNNVLEGSRTKTDYEQKEIVEKVFGYERPNAREVVALIVTTFISSGKRLYSTKPYTYARGPEVVGKNYPVVVGSFGVPGLYVTTLPYSFFIGEYYGAAAFRRV